MFCLYSFNEIGFLIGEYWISPGQKHKLFGFARIVWQASFVLLTHQGRRHRVTIFCGDMARWLTANCILRWMFPMNHRMPRNMMSNHICSDRPLPTCKTSIVVTATIFIIFKANIQRWRPSAAPPLLWFPLYCLNIRDWTSCSSPFGESSETFAEKCGGPSHRRWHGAVIHRSVSSLCFCPKKISTRRYKIIPID